MLIKRVIFILFLLIITIGALSGVSANDSAEDIAANASEDEIGIEDLGEEIVENAVADDGILKSKDDGTFAALQSKINNAYEGSTIYLENDYYYNSDFGSKDGVKITKSLTIDGNGHVIDGMLKSALLKVDGAGTVTLKNIIFMNGRQNNNYVVGISNTDNLNLYSCRFLGNQGTVGGTLTVSGVGTSSITNCTFFRNMATNNGGAVSIHDTGTSSIERCKFETNTNNQYGGAVAVWSVDSSDIIDCSFKGNFANDVGGAVFLYDINLSSIGGCNFSDNMANQGGAIFAREIKKLSLFNSNFKMNAAEDGGAIYSIISNSFSFVGCNFTSNSAIYGGAVLLDYGIYMNSFDSCNFIANSATTAGGAIYTSYSNGSSFLKCAFSYNNATHGNGGAIFSQYVDNNIFDHCAFIMNWVIGYGGGAVYLNKTLCSRFDSCDFNLNYGLHGGSIFAYQSTLVLENSLSFYSFAQGYGGVMDCQLSDVTINNCHFDRYFSSSNAGGAVYSLKGKLNICDSSFTNGLATYGGAISSLESNFTLKSSKFINNSASNGGAIYSMYGNIDVDKSFFNNSHAATGSAILCELSESSIFTNNVFLNSTAKVGSAIYLIHPSSNHVESGNHFEDVYHMYIGYIAYKNGQQIKSKSKVLYYILSNTGNYLNNYDYLVDDAGYGDVVRLDFGDSDYPNNFKVFGNYDKTFVQNINIVGNSNVDNEQLYLFVWDDGGDNLYLATARDIQEILENYSQFDYTFENKTLEIAYSLNEVMGSSINPVTLFESSPSSGNSIPSAYDSRDYGYITPIENQYVGGNCWAFAGLATLEACVKKITNMRCDFSEENAKNLMALYSVLGLSLNTNRGGYDSMVMAYLNSWLGPINDVDDEQYDSYSLISKIYDCMLHIQNIKFLPARKNSMDNDAIKRAIMDYGAVSVTFYWPEEGYHAVSIVGWNDNYNRVDSLGTYTTGAWIFKNSWGPNWGDNGFGYLSYTTPFTSDVNDFAHAYTFIFHENEEYIYNYQYDNAGVTDYIVNDDGHLFYKNKFVAHTGGYRGEPEYLSAFSTYFKIPTDYKVSVYVNDTLVLTQKGHSDAGYYTIPFNKKITVPSGDEFTIMIENCNSGKNMFPVCQSDELNRANFVAGNSLFSYDGVHWMDLYDLEEYTEFSYGGVKSDTCQVACIKAFFSLGEPYKTSIDVDRIGSVDVGQEVRVSISVKAGDYYFNSLVLIDGTLINFDINGKEYFAIIRDGKASLPVKFEEGGIHTLTAQYKNNVYESNIVKFTFNVNKKNSVISANSVSKVYGGSEKSVVTLKDDSGKVIANEYVTFSVNGKATKVRTNANGQASIPISLAPKSYTAIVSFAGSSKYKGATAKVNVVVKKAASKITAKGVTLNVKKVKKYSVTLKDNKGKAIKNAKLTLKVNGRTFKATTNAKGKATFKLKISKKCNVKATIKFSGNAYYNAVSKKVNVAVKK